MRVTNKHAAVGCVRFGTDALQELCRHTGVDVRSASQQVQGFSETTDVHKLAIELEEKLPEL